MSLSKLAVVSVQHTGTRFTESLFNWPSAALNERPSREVIHVGHISHGQLPHIKALAKSAPLVMPLRHPYLVAESWKRRGKPIDELIGMFRVMHDDVLPLEPLVIAVDSEGRDEQLQATSETLGIPLTTDWTPRNSKAGTYTLSWRELTPEPEIEALADDMSDFLSKFY